MAFFPFDDCMSMTLKTFSIFLVLGFLAACDHTVTEFPSAPISEVQGEARRQTGDLAAQYLIAIRRLARTTEPMLIANAELCPRRARSLGFSVISDFDLPVELRNVAYARMKLNSDAQVLNVVPGTEAWDKGLRTGDTIVLLNGKLVRNAADWRARLRKVKGDTASIGFMRDGRSFEITVTPVPICNYRLVYKWRYEASDGRDENAYRAINAWATGSAIYVTQGMIDFADDEELALVMGHELAHNIMHHIRKKRTNTMIIDITSNIVDTVTGSVGLGEPANALLQYLETKKWSPRFEKEADYVGLYLLARAGGNIDGAAALERRLGVSGGPDNILHTNPIYPHTHPMSAERAAIQARTVAEIHAKQRQGLDLMPNLRTSWVFGQKYSIWDAEEEDPWLDEDLNH